MKHSVGQLVKFTGAGACAGTEWRIEEVRSDGTYACAPYNAWARAYTSIYLPRQNGLAYFCDAQVASTTSLFDVEEA